MERIAGFSSPPGWIKPMPCSVVVLIALTVTLSTRATLVASHTARRISCGGGETRHAADGPGREEAMQWSLRIMRAAIADALDA